MEKTKATITFVDISGLTLRYDGKTGYKCPLEKLHLLPWHDLHKIFRIDGEFPVKDVNSYICVPSFSHPHDRWIERNHLHLCCEARIIYVERDTPRASAHIILQLDENVLAHAESTNQNYKIGDDVLFIPESYDTENKKILGTID